jgi:hypothetical protein
MRDCLHSVNYGIHFIQEQFAAEELKAPQSSPSGRGPKLPTARLTLSLHFLCKVSVIYAFVHLDSSWTFRRLYLNRWLQFNNSGLDYLFSLEFESPNRNQRFED